MFSTTKEMEALILTPQEYERKIALLERRASKFEEKSKKAGAALIRVKKQYQELKKSRDSLKAKSRVKSLTIKSLKKQVSRIDKPARHHFPLDLMHLSFLFRQKGKCSYTSISRLLGILGTCRVLDLPRVPCANTVQNWVSKMGLNTLEEGGNSLDTSHVSLMVDESIKIGEEKLLVVLCCASDKSQLGTVSEDKPRLEKVIGGDLGIIRPHCLDITEQSGLSLSDMRICHIESRKAWTGLEISYVLTQVINKLAVSGQTVDYIQTDGESKLKNAIDLLVVLPQALDISHSIGNCLKKTFEKEEAFINFTKLLGNYQSKGVNQALTYLIPPKQRSKVRFMNLKPVVVWAKKMLVRMGHLNEKESAFFNELPQHAPFVEVLTEVMFLEEKVTKALKTNGLTQHLLVQIIQELTLFKALNFGIYNNLKDKFAVYFEGFLAKYQTLIDQTKVHNLVSLNVSTDIIESLFAKYKAIMPSNKYHSMASTAIELPIYCTDNDISQQQIKQAVEKYFTANLIEWKESYSVESQAVKRRKFFKK